MTSLLFAGFLFLYGCAAARQEQKSAAPGPQGLKIAVYPIENLSGEPVHLNKLRMDLISALKSRGIKVLDDRDLDKFMTEHRVRYIGGIDAGRAKAFKAETGTGGVLITSIELINEYNPPRLSVVCRLVSTGDNPRILWIEDAGMAGDDNPGILGLGIIDNLPGLEKRAFGKIAGSLAGYLQKGEARPVKTYGKFSPKIHYRSPILDSDHAYRIAVVPFLNRSERKNAGELMALHFVDALRKAGFSVVEPGMVREGLLDYRVIMEGGLSIPNAETVFNNLNADLVIIGYVSQYQDATGPAGNPVVEFFVNAIEKKSMEVVWASDSYNRGDDGVFFFDRGRVSTAGVMADRMAQAVVKMMKIKLKTKKSNGRNTK